jgi:hypothetical protein
MRCNLERDAPASCWCCIRRTPCCADNGAGRADEQIVILPKLFRRLIDYLALDNGDPSLDGFTAFLTARDDRLFVISEADATSLDNITTITGQTLKLTHPPEDLIFIEA